MTLAEQYGTEYHERLDPKECPICKRLLDYDSCSRHHLIPQLKGGKNKETILIHDICHSKIHSLFSESELAYYYNTVDKLTEHTEMQKFIKWIKNKPANFNAPSKIKRK